VWFDYRVGQIDNPTKEMVAMSNDNNEGVKPNDNISENPEMVVITSTKVRKAHADFVQAKLDENDAKVRKAQAEAILRQALGEFGKVGYFGKTKAFSLVSSRNTSVKRDVLEEKYPVAFADEEVWNITPYDYIRTA
jgi:hypothetical protein